MKSLSTTNTKMIHNYEKLQKIKATPDEPQILWCGKC